MYKHISTLPLLSLYSVPSGLPACLPTEDASDLPVAPQQLPSEPSWSSSFDLGLDPKLGDEDVNAAAASPSKPRLSPISSLNSGLDF